MTDTKLAHELLSDMVRVRRMEEKCAELYSAAKICGFLHLYVGEEAVAAGSLRALADDDAVVATYREHAHALLRGIPMTSIMAEMFGKQEGCSRGRGGSMHLFDASKRFYGGNAIVAGGLPLAVGIALADAMLQQKRVTACYFRGRRGGRGRVSRVVEHGRAVELAGVVLLREQPLRDGHRIGACAVADRSHRQSGVVPRTHAGCRRDGCRGMPHSRTTRCQSRPRHRRAVLHRVPHLPVPCAFDVRPGTVSGQGRGRAMARA